MFGWENGVCTDGLTASKKGFWVRAAWQETPWQGKGALVKLSSQPWWPPTTFCCSSVLLLVVPGWYKHSCLLHNLKNMAGIKSLVLGFWFCWQLLFFWLVPGSFVTYEVSAIVLYFRFNSCPDGHTCYLIVDNAFVRKAVHCTVLLIRAILISDLC